MTDHKVLLNQAAEALAAYMGAVRYAQDADAMVAAIRYADQLAHPAYAAIFAVLQPDDGERMPQPQRPTLTPTNAQALDAASRYADACAAVEVQRFGTAGYYQALAACDEAWEAIARACGVGVLGGDAKQQDHQRVVKGSG